VWEEESMLNEHATRRFLREALDVRVSSAAAEESVAVWSSELEAVLVADAASSIARRLVVAGAEYMQKSSFEEVTFRIVHSTLLIVRVLVKVELKPCPEILSSVGTLALTMLGSMPVMMRGYCTTLVDCASP